MSRDYKTRKPSATKPEKGNSAFFGGFVGYALGLASAIAIWLYLNFAQNPFLKNEKAAAVPEKSQQQPVAGDAHKTLAKVPEEPVNQPEEKPKFDFYKILPGIDEPEIDYSTRKINDDQPKSPQITTAPTETNNKTTEIPVQTATPPKPVVAPPVEAAAVQPRPIPLETKSQPSQQLPPPQPSVQQPITPQTVNPPAAKEKIFLQAGSFRRIDDAENMKARLALLGVFASIQPIDLADRGIFYRVRVGPFNNKSNSDQVSASLQENGIETQFLRLP